MSDKRKIKVVVHDEKANMEKTVQTAQNIRLTQDTSMTLMSILLKNRLMDGSFCGGRGDCGRCLVQFLKGAPLPTGLERTRLTPEELRQGYRLACMSRPKVDCVIKIVGTEETEISIVSEVMLPSEKIDLSSRQNKLSENQKATVTKSRAEQINQRKLEKKKSRRYVIAVDLGTTTIAMQLRDVETGEAADTYCERNPQRIYGTDVLSRIQASCSGSGEELRRLVCGSLLRGVGHFAEFLRGQEAVYGLADEPDPVHGLKKIVCMCIAGNTTMEHLLMGYDVETLGRSPFVPVEAGLQEVAFNDLFQGIRDFSREEPDDMLWRQVEFPVYIAPCISAFVGGDIVAGLYTLRMPPVFVDQDTDLRSIEGKEDKEEASDGSGRRAVLLIDLGTNGEMAITDGDCMIATATAAGPAFEGDGSLIGTDRIAFTAELLRKGILDETGLLAEPYFTEGVCIEKENVLKENKCYFNQKDVRALQMAKAAVRAGVEILWEEMGRPEIEQVYLSGGFGYYLDVEAAIAIGLLPSNMRGRVLATGNTSLAGAYEIGRDLFRGRLEAALLEGRLSSITSINLAQRENFEKLYLKYMNLEEN